LIAHYELDNLQLVEHLIKSVYRFLSKMESLDAVLTQIFEFLKKSLSSNPQDVKKSFVELRNKLEIISTRKYNRRSYQYLDIVSWLDSKIENMAVEEVIRRKFMKG
jgi:UTP:GlnB (protein PII) uridylyltransferase